MTPDEHAVSTVEAQVAEVLHAEIHPRNPIQAHPEADDPRHRIAACYECIRAAAVLAPLIAEREREAARGALVEAQQVIAGEDTIEWARKAKGSYVTLPWAMELLDDLIEERADAVAGEDEVRRG